MQSLVPVIPLATVHSFSTQPFSWAGDRQSGLLRVVTDRNRQINILVSFLHTHRLVNIQCLRIYRLNFKLSSENINSS